MSDIARHILSILNTDYAVLLGGFLIGFARCFKLERKTLKYPLSVLWKSTCVGAICSTATGFVGHSMPSEVKFMIPVMAIISYIYYKYIDIFDPPTDSGKNKNKIRIGFITITIE